MLKRLHVGETLVILIVSGIVWYFLRLALDKWNAEEWGLVALGAFAALGVFALLVYLVNLLFSHKNGDDTKKYNRPKRRG
jgi:Zn-dependent protease with chaperone function